MNRPNHRTSRRTPVASTLAVGLLLGALPFACSREEPAPPPAPPEPAAEVTAEEEVREVEDAAPAAPATLTGTVGYRLRIALPPEAIVSVRLEDTSLADAPATTIAAVSIPTEGRQVPIPFMLEYDPADIEPDRTYSVRATIEIDGQLRWTSTRAYQVITRNNPTAVDLIVDPVGEAPAPLPAPPADPVGTAVLLETPWRLAEIGGVAFVATEGSRDPSLTLLREESRLAAQGHCNRHMGTYALGADGSIELRPTVSTRMACLSAEIEAAEREFIAALGAANRYEVRGTTLLLKDGDMVIARFVAVDTNK